MSRGEVREEDITRALAEWLEERGWELCSVHYPGTQGGLRFRRAAPGERALDAIVPDIVALLGSNLLVVESKPAYSSSDVAKLERLARDSAYRSDICRAARVECIDEVKLITGIAYAGASPEQPPSDFLLFVYCDRAITVHGEVRLPHSSSER